MALPVTIVASGGLAVTDTGAANALPMSPMANGTPVTVVAGGGLPVCFLDDDGAVIGSETVSLLSSMTVAPSQARASLINDTIAALKTADLWDDLDVLYVLAAHDAQAARLNWKAPGTYTASVISTPTFTADQGYTGNGTDAALDTGWIPATNAVQLTTNAGHAAAWTLTSRATSATHALFGARNAANTRMTELFPNLNSGGAFAFGRISEVANGVTAPANIQGFWVIDRPDSTGLSVYKDDALVGSPSGDTAVGLPDRSMYFLATNGGSVVTPTSDQISIFTAGAALGSTKRTALYGIMEDYLQAVGAVA